MKNVNELGYGYCPSCKTWMELTRYHPRDEGLPRKEKNKYCIKCILDFNNSRDPFYRIKIAINNHKKLAREGDYNFDDIMKLHKHQGGVCAYCRCGIPYEFSLDHIIPKKFGGRNILKNIILTCISCNSAKQHFEPFFFLRRKKYVLTERVIKRLKGAYDYHDYTCDATCKDCSSSGKAGLGYFCKDCSILA